MQKKSYLCIRKFDFLHFMKKLLIILAAAYFSVGCIDSYKQTDRTFNIQSTVNAYFEFIRVKENKPIPHAIVAAYISWEEMTILLSLVGEHTGSIYDLIDNPNSDNATAYKAAQAKFGDYNTNTSTFRYYTNKDGGEWMLESGPCYYYCFSEQITKISITSNAAWGADYPAGSELGSLFVAEFASLAPYVKRGFTGTPETYIKKIVSELTADDMALMMERDWNIFGGQDLSFTTTTIPENISEHTITISLTLDTGEVIKYSEDLAKYHI